MSNGFFRLEAVVFGDFVAIVDWQVLLGSRWLSLKRHKNEVLPNMGREALPK